jgi:cold shock CspA family protein
VKGTITKVILTRGFGFIVADDDAEDYFLHVDEIHEDVRWETLRKGTRVEFEGKVVPNGKGNQLRAVNVRVIE